MSPQIEIIIIASLVAIACALPGVFLVLRRVSLMSDAISHAILLGIVIAFFYAKDLSSPWLFVGATIVGVLTVTLTEIVIKTRKLKEDAAIGLVFPLLFSIGVILLTKFANDVHLDTQCVLLGEIAFAPFNRFILNGVDFGPKGIWMIGGVLLLNIVFITIFYKELKVSTFDPGLAAAMGFSPLLLHYALMTLVSVTCVGAFETVGSILVVALIITPPAAAYLLTDRLSSMLVISGVIGLLSALSGYWVSAIFNTSIAGAMATMSGVIFVLVLIFAPERGLLAKYVLRRFRRFDFATQTLAVHLLQSEWAQTESTENLVGHMKDHMSWSDQYTSDIIAQAINEGLIIKDGNYLKLTDYGREQAKQSMSK